MSDTALLHRLSRPGPGLEPPIPPIHSASPGAGSANGPSNRHQTVTAWPKAGGDGCDGCDGSIWDKGYRKKLATTADIDSLKAKLKRAIASGRQKGIDTSAWEQRLRQLEQAEYVAQETRRQLDAKGWCLWQCRSLGDDTIAIIRDEPVKGVPPGFPVYTEDELRKLARMKSVPWRLVYAAKKLAGARVAQVEVSEA